MPVKTTKYAEGTQVSIPRSRDEIERTLKRHGATGFMYGEQGGRAAIAFELKGRQYRMELDYPPRSKFERMQPNQYTARMNPKQRAEDAFEQEKARLWRGLALLVKAKLEAIESGISTLEMEMQPYTVMTNNERVGEWLEPQLAQMYKSGQMPDFIPGLPQPRQKQIGSSGIIEGETRDI